MSAILGVILAGGAGRRIGGAKPMRVLGGRPLLAHVAARIAPQVQVLAVNSPPGAPEFGRFGLPVVADEVPGLGPIGGIMTGLRNAERLLPGCSAILFAPADCPFLPTDLASKLAQRMYADHVPLACAESGGRRHPTVSLWSPGLADALADLVVNQRVGAAHEALDCLGGISVPFSGQPFDPFFNINRPADLARAEKIHQALEAGQA